MADGFGIGERVRGLAQGVRERVVAEPVPPPSGPASPVPASNAPPGVTGHATGIERALHNPGAAHRSAEATATLEHLLGGGVHTDPASHQQLVDSHSAHDARGHQVIGHPNPHHFERPAAPPGSEAWWAGRPRFWPDFSKARNLIDGGARR